MRRRRAALAFRAALVPPMHREAILFDLLEDVCAWRDGEVN